VIQTGGRGEELEREKRERRGYDDLHKHKDDTTILVLLAGSIFFFSKLFFFWLFFFFFSGIFSQ